MFGWNAGLNCCDDELQAPFVPLGEPLIKLGLLIGKDAMKS